MNFYIKNTGVNRVIDEKEYLSSEKYKKECEDIKKFILERKHVMGYIHEKYDDFVLNVFPTRHDIIHFEIDHIKEDRSLKTAVRGILVKTEEAYEQISENIDDKDTHLEFLNTPNPPAVTVDIQENFINIYESSKNEIDEMLIKIGAVLLDIKL